MESNSLDAAFALLDDVRAQSFALQLRLRSALPARWSGSALVLQRDIRPTVAVNSVTTTLLNDVGRDEASNWRHQRHCRQIEWDVAKRIARIDRELASLPPAQRFWHRRQRRREQQLASVKQQEEAEARSSRAKATAEESAAQRAQGDKRPLRGRVAATVVAADVKGEAGTTARMRHTRVERDYQKTKYASRAKGEREAQAGASKTPVHKSPVERSTIQVREESSKAVASPCGMVSPLKVTKVSIDTPAKTSLATTPLSAAATSKQLGATSVAEPELDTFTSAREEKENQPPPSAGATVNRQLRLDLQPEEDDDEVFQEHRETKPAAARLEFPQQTSSVGRQVLSEYRNAPSTAMYGPPAVTGNMDTRERRLNSDVLRRLFSDLDTNRDGHLNRIETCMALHRLQISVPAPKIAAFFRRVYVHPDAHSTAKRSSYRGNLSRADQHIPLMEVINYKQFAAFVTAAYDRQRERLQQQQQQQPVSAASNEHQVYRHQNARSSVNDERHNDDSERMLRSTPKQQVTYQTPATTVDAPGPDTLLYELDTPQDDQLERSVLETLPDYLMSRLLESEEIPKTRAEDTKDKSTTNFVRRSLEKLLPRDVVDAQVSGCGCDSRLALRGSLYSRSHAVCIYLVAAAGAGDRTGSDAGAPATKVPRSE